MVVHHRVCAATCVPEVSNGLQSYGTATLKPFIEHSESGDLICRNLLACLQLGDHRQSGAVGHCGKRHHAFRRNLNPVVLQDLLHSGHQGKRQWANPLMSNIIVLIGEMKTEQPLNDLCVVCIRSWIVWIRRS